MIVSMRRSAIPSAACASLPSSQSPSSRNGAAVNRSTSGVIPGLVEPLVILTRQRDRRKRNKIIKEEKTTSIMSAIILLLVLILLISISLLLYVYATFGWASAINDSSIPNAIRDDGSTTIAAEADMQDNQHHRHVSDSISARHIRSAFRSGIFGKSKVQLESGNDGNNEDISQDASMPNSNERNDVALLSRLVPGCSLSIYWPEDGEYYNAEIAAIPSNTTTNFHVRYDDGERGVVNLATTPFRILGIRYRDEDIPDRDIMLQRAAMERELVAQSGGKPLKNYRQRSPEGLACSRVAAEAKAAWVRTSDEESTSEAPKLRGKVSDSASIQYEQYHFKETVSGGPICSDNPLAPGNISYTLVTQASYNRLWMLNQHCLRWDGPISVAIFTDKSIKDVWNYLENENTTSCRTDQLHIETLSTVGYNDGNYPINKLRNLAIHSVQTTHAVVVDVDFWPSRDMLRILSLDLVRNELAADDKLAIVVPSFEYRPSCHAERKCKRDQAHIAAMPQNKSHLVRLVEQDLAGVFDPSNYRGFLSTRYNTWFNMVPGDLMDLPCIVSDKYEPFVVARYCGDKLPPFQDAFTGYGKNKIVYHMQMRRAGYQLSLVGGAFLVHYPHERSKTREVWNIGWKQMNKLGRTALRRRQQQQQQQGGVQNLTDTKIYQVEVTLKAFKTWMNEVMNDDSRVPICNGGPRRY